MIKKMALMALMAGFAGQAYAVVACDNAAPFKKTIPIGSPVAFIKTAFPQVCSQNVLLRYSETAVVAAVGAASVKGKNSFMGHTDGGSPQKHLACASTTACATTDVDTALTAAAAAAGT